MVGNLCFNNFKRLTAELGGKELKGISILRQEMTEEKESSFDCELLLLVYSIYVI